MGCCTPAGDEGLEGEVDDPSLNEDDPAAVLLNMASLAHTQQPSDMPAGLSGAAALMHTAPPPGAGDGAAAAAAAAQTVEAQTRSGLVYAQVCRQRRRARACVRCTGRLGHCTSAAAGGSAGLWCAVEPRSGGGCWSIVGSRHAHDEHLVAG